MPLICFLRALEATDSGVITAMSPQVLIGPLLGFYESSSLLALYLMIWSLKSSNNLMWKQSWLDRPHVQHFNKMGYDNKNEREDVIRKTADRDLPVSEECSWIHRYLIFGFREDQLVLEMALQLKDKDNWL